MSIHPPEICALLVRIWPSVRLHEKPDLPRVDLLLELLECAHAASLTREEGRIIAFRLLLLPPSASLRAVCDDKEMTAVEFDHPRGLTQQALRRLAPATDPSTTMIAIGVDSPSAPGALSILGLASMGSAWQDFSTGKTESGTGPPSLLMLSVSGPGTMRVECGVSTIIGTEKDVLLGAPQNVLKEGPVFEFILPALEELAGEALDTTADRPRFFWDAAIYLRFLVRVLTLCREQQHGGMFLMLRRPDDYREMVTVKYPCRLAKPWELLLKLRALIYEWLPGKPDEESAQARKQLDAANREAEDLAHLLAKMAAVDGCVILSDRLEVLGFGAVVVSATASHSPDEIFLCSDASGKARERRRADGYGTRHQAAFRICSATEDALAFVLSQDGGVRAVIGRNSEVMVFEEVALGPQAWFLTTADAVGDLLPRPGAPE